MIQAITLHYSCDLTFGFGSLNRFFSDYSSLGLKRLFILAIPALRPLLGPYLDQLAISGILAEVNDRVKAEPTFTIFEDALDEMTSSALKVQRLLKNNVREVTCQDALNISTSLLK